MKISIIEKTRLISIEINQQFGGIIATGTKVNRQ